MTSRSHEESIQFALCVCCCCCPFLAHCVPPQHRRNPFLLFRLLCLPQCACVLRKERKREEAACKASRELAARAPTLLSFATYLMEFVIFCVLIPGGGRLQAFRRTERFERSQNHSHRLFTRFYLSHTHIHGGGNCFFCPCAEPVTTMWGCCPAARTAGTQQQQQQRQQGQQNCIRAKIIIIETIFHALAKLKLINGGIVGVNRKGNRRGSPVRIFVEASLTLITGPGRYSTL